MRQAILCAVLEARLTKTVLSLALLATVLASCTPIPQPFPQVRLGGNRLQFPLAMTGGYHWQRSGYGRPPQSPVNDRELRGRGMWHYTWGMGDCLYGVPMVFSGHDLPTPEALSRCSSTSPLLLVFNEPEWGSQGNTTPADGAKALRYLEQHWPGELWCCGNLASHAGWLNAMLTEYKQEFDELPRLTGIHLHVYVNDGYQTDAPSDPAWLARSQTEFARYRAVVERWGLPERFVITECCALHGDDLVPVMDGYMEWLRSEPGIESVAWFSARYGGFPDANLLEQGGGLTEIGEAWLGWRWRWR
jgi:hypothetical protein